MDDNVSADVPPQPEPVAGDALAGVWRRLLAFLIDCLLLGLFGQALGLIAADQLAALGNWGRALGFAIATTYFAVMDSRLFGGQSLGARLSKIRVVTRDGRALGLGASMLRTTLFTLPYCLNGAAISIDPSMSLAMVLFSIVVFGLGLSIVYLFLFNRSTRQCPHDLAVGAYVVKAEYTQPLAVGPIWRGHFVVLAVILLIAGVVPLYASKLARQSPFAELMSVQQAVLSLPGVEFAGVNQSHNSVVVFGKGKTVTDVLSARVRVSDKAIARSELANRVAAVILEQYPASAQQDRITISMDYGFDIGIASSWHSEHVSLPPGEWRQRLTAAAEAKAVMPATQE